MWRNAIRIERSLLLSSHMVKLPHTTRIPGKRLRGGEAHSIVLPPQSSAVAESRYTYRRQFVNDMNQGIKNSEGRLTRSGGKASSCDHDDVPARLYHLTKLVHVSAGPHGYCPLVSNSAGSGDEAWNLKDSKPGLVVRWKINK